MSDAEATIKQAILVGLISSVIVLRDDRRVCITNETVDAILDRVFEKPVRWAIKEYLKELAE